jgi:phage gpG-like protein
MATVTWQNRLDLGAVRALMANPAGGVAQDMLRRGLKVETQAKRNLGGVGGPKRVDSGRLRASINTQLVKAPNGAYMAIVGTNVNYARWVHDGTGVYGPRHRLIRPIRRKYLRFRPGGRGRFVYARFVVGMKPNRFLTNALPAARD